MAKPIRSTVTVPSTAYRDIQTVARLRKRKVPGLIVELAADAARRELAAAKRREVFQKGLAAIFEEMTAEEIRSLSRRLRDTLDQAG